MIGRTQTMIAILGLMLTMTASAQIPRTMSYQGVLTDPSGEALPDGSHALELRLYGSATGGAPTYSETHTVQTNGGVFSVVIGSSTPLPASLTFDLPYYLGIAVDGGTELAPRTALTSAPYALYAARAGIAEGLAPNVTGVVTSLNGQSGAVTLQGGGSTTVTQSAGTITISSSGGSGGSGIQGVQNTDGTITIADPNGPIATLGLADNAVTSDKIADGSIAAADLADGVTPTTLPPSGPAGGDLSGTYPNPAIAVNAVTSAKIADASIATADLADGSVTPAKISSAGASTDQVLTYNGTTIVFAAPTLPLPFSATVNAATDVWSITNTGGGRVGYFRLNNATGAAHTLVGESNANAGWNGPAAIYGRHTGTSGIGVFGEAPGTAAQGITPRGVYGVSPSGSGVYGYSTAGDGLTGANDGAGNGIMAYNNGTGRAAFFQIINAANSSIAVHAATNGTGRAGYFVASNAQNSAHALEATTAGTGHGILGARTATTGTNAGVRGETNSASNGTNTIAGATGVYGIALPTAGGGWSAGVRGINNSTTGNGIGTVGYQAGSGWGVLGESVGGTGVRAVSGTGGNGLVAVYTGVAVSTVAADNIAVFQAPPRTGGLPVNQARIDAIGRGFFNGGTLNAGADVAEMFDVEGERSTYEPGDVLVISTDNDRTVEKSSTPYSTLVVGVYATKPGVILSERSIDADHSDMAPMGVIGVIPTKVSSENGPIRRGDLLVSSSTTGHAMRADPDKAKDAPGSIIGKALENFDGDETGTIKVLVNVR